MSERYVFAVDLGAGDGAKIGLFPITPKKPIQEGFLPRTEYPTEVETFAQTLQEKAQELLHSRGATTSQLVAAGICSPGIFAQDGSYIGVSNIPSLEGKNLRKSLEDKLAVPVGIMNDADAGGLAEWSVVKKELLYWVVGGGWGGAWLSREGRVLHPAIDWDGKDESLHLTNEPGYATALPTSVLSEMFQKYSFDFVAFIRNLEQQSDSANGPNRDQSTLRAEAIVSGPGVARLYNSSCVKINPSRRTVTSGKEVYELARQDDPIALATFQLFGEVFASAAKEIVSKAIEDGAPGSIPIYLAGRPCSSFPYFGPTMQEKMWDSGITSELRISRLFGQGQNPNLLGAAVLATQVLK